MGSISNEKVRVWVAALAAAIAGAVVLSVVLTRRDEPPPGPEAFIARPDHPVTDSARFEPVQDEISDRINDLFRTGLGGRDDAAIRTMLTEDFLGRLPSPEAGSVLEEEGLRVVRLDCRDLPSTGAKRFLEDLRRHTEAFASIERCRFQCFEFLLDPSETRATAAFHWHLAGRRAGGRPIEIQAEPELELVRQEDGWRIRRFGLRRATRIESDLLPFVEVSAQTGFNFAYSREARALIQGVTNNRDDAAVVGCLSVVDWNRDDLPDVIASHRGRRAALFLNDGQGGFLPRALPGEAAIFYLYVDLDNDGREELVTSNIRAYRERQASLELYTRPRDTWELRPEAMLFENPPAHRELHYPHIAAGDVNGDGLLDLFFSGYGRSLSGEIVNLVNSNVGLRNLLFINQGALQFSEESTERGIAGTPWTYVSELFDMDRDGDLDLLEVNDFGPNAVYRNQGAGTFVEEPDHPFSQGTTFGMGLAISDYDNTGEFSFYFSYMYSHAGRRMVPLAPELSPESRSRLAFSARGNALYERSGTAWTERGEELGVHNAGWAWGCVFFDADNDTDKDLLVVNGFTSNRDPNAPEY